MEKKLYYKIMKGKYSLGFDVYDKKDCFICYSTQCKRVYLFENIQDANAYMKGDSYKVVSICTVAEKYNDVLVEKYLSKTIFGKNPKIENGRVYVPAKLDQGLRRYSWFRTYMRGGNRTNSNENLKLLDELFNKDPLTKRVLEDVSKNKIKEIEFNTNLPYYHVEGVTYKLLKDKSQDSYDCVEMKMKNGNNIKRKVNIVIDIDYKHIELESEHLKLVTYDIDIIDNTSRIKSNKMKLMIQEKEGKPSLKIPLLNSLPYSYDLETINDYVVKKDLYQASPLTPQIYTCYKDIYNEYSSEIDELLNKFVSEMKKL